MTHAHRHFSWAPRLVPATVASLVSLFAIAPAETAINRFLHAPHPHVATTHDTDTTPEIVLTTHHGPHENPSMRLQRYAYKPHQPQDDDAPGACADACFDPNAFEPASGGVSGGEHGARPAGQDGGGEPIHGDSFDPPSSPSQEAQFDTAGIGEFAQGGNGGGSTTGGGGGQGGPGGSGGSGGAGDNDGGTSFVLLPGAGASGGANGTGGGTGEGADENTSTQRSDGGGGGGGGGSGGGSTGSPSFAGNGGNGGNTGDDGDTDESEIETISLRVAPAAAPLEVSAPGTISLFTAAVALLAFRRRTY